MAADARVRALLLLVVTFLVGAIAGAATDRRFNRVPRAPQPATKSAPPANVERIPQPLEDLGLSDSETARLHVIARRWRPQTSTALTEFRHRVSDMEDGMFAEMLCVLAADKRDRYLAHLHEQHYDEQIITRRFELVRSNRCGKAAD